MWLTGALLAGRWFLLELCTILGASALPGALLASPHLQESRWDFLSGVLRCRPHFRGLGSSGEDPHGLGGDASQMALVAEWRLMLSSFGDGCVSYFQARSMMRTKFSLPEIPSEMGKLCKHTRWPHTSCLTHGVRVQMSSRLFKHVPATCSRHGRYLSVPRHLLLCSEGRGSC